MTMRHGTRLSTDQTTTARDAYERGLSLRSIASLLHVHHETIRRLATAQGWERVGEEARERAEERRQQTEAATQAARESWANLRADEARSAGITGGLVRRALRKAAGIPEHPDLVKEIVMWEAGDDKLITALARAYSVLVDGAERLSDQSAEVRVVMTPEARRERAARLDELAAKRAEKAANG